MAIKVVTKAQREFQPSHVRKNTFGWFEMDDHGSFRIVVKDSDGQLHRSFPTYYQGIATLEVEKQHYIAVSAFYDGGLKCEQVIKLEYCKNES